MFAIFLFRLFAFFRRYLRWFPAIAGIIAAIIAALVAMSSPINNSSVAGTWLLAVDGQAELYTVLDGNGGVTTASNFFNQGGTYNVTSGGDFTMAWNEAGAAPIQFTGTFTSEDAGNFTQPKTGTLTRVPDRGAMAGLWYASFDRSVDATEHQGGTFTVDDSGAIVASSGDLALVGGSMFIAGDGVVMHALTTRSDAWVEVDAHGSGDTQHVTGDLVLDTGFGRDGSFIFSRDPIIGNATVAGAWMLSIGGQPQLYTILDGNGVVSSASNFFNAGGDYHVNGDGSFTMSLNEAGSAAIDFTGAFTSDSTGTFSGPANGDMNKIPDVSAMSGLWYATYRRTVGASQTKTGTFTVDANGAIVASTGQVNVVGGHIFIADGKVVMHGVTTSTDPWVEVGAIGTGTTQNVSGALNLDSPYSSDGTFTFTRTPPPAPITTASVAGAWLLVVGGVPSEYAILNGAGIVTEASNFFGTGGTYSVGSGGAFSMRWNQASGPSFLFSGTFSSPTTGTYTGPASGTLIKVSDVSALQGTWGGDFKRTTNSGGTNSVEFTIDASGAVINASGDIIITKGHIFEEGGNVVFHLWTNVAHGTGWDEITGKGAGDPSMISGDMQLESPYTKDGTFEFISPPPVNN